MNPYLKKIRKGFRDVWLSWCSDVISKLRDTRWQNNIDKDGIPVFLDHLPLDNVKQHIRLSIDIRELSHLYWSCPFRCGMCKSSYNNLKYNKHLGQWFCVDCRRILYSSYKGKKEESWFIEDKDLQHRGDDEQNSFDENGEYTYPKRVYWP